MYVPEFDLYAVLRVEPSVSSEDLKKAYRTRARETHPDKFSTAPEEKRKEMEEEFKRVQTAYAWLSDASKRSLYDMMPRRRGETKPPPPSETAQDPWEKWPDEDPFDWLQRVLRMRAAQARAARESGRWEDAQWDNDSPFANRRRETQEQHEAERRRREESAQREREARERREREREETWRRGRSRWDRARSGGDPSNAGGQAWDRHSRGGPQDETFYHSIGLTMAKLQVVIVEMFNEAKEKTTPMQAGQCQRVLPRGLGLLMRVGMENHPMGIVYVVEGIVLARENSEPGMMEARVVARAWFVSNYEIERIDDVGNKKYPVRLKIKPKK